MNKMLKNALKTSIAFAIIGTGITLAAPTVGAALGQVLGPVLDAIAPGQASVFAEGAGSAVSIGKAAWTGVFFAMFGAASAVIPPIVGKALGLNEKEKAPEIKIEEGRGISVKLQQENELEQASDHGFPGIDDDKRPEFVAKLSATTTGARER